MDLTHALAGGASKQERIIDEKAVGVRAEKTASMLLDACTGLTNPVIGAVRDYLKERSDNP
jgi:hypothetical protein